MNPNIDELLSAPMDDLPAEPFTEMTMQTLLKKHQAYIKMRQRVLGLCGLLCLAFVSAFRFSFSSDFTPQLAANLPIAKLASKFSDLSTLFLDTNTVFVIFCAAITGLVVISSETFANN